MTSPKKIPVSDSALWTTIKRHALESLDFDAIATCDGNLEKYIPHYNQWLSKGYHGDMDYMHKHGSKRYIPDELVEGTQSIIMVRLHYQPISYTLKSWLTSLKHDSQNAEISRYALGRDYHKVIRKKLKALGSFMQQHIPELEFRVFTDSAPVLEKPLAEKAGLGWIGKNGNLIDQQQGSFFFLGAMYVNINLNEHRSPTPQADLCGKCKACIKICPTQAIVANKVVDARRCISYLTIEHKGAIPIEFRKAIGNRIYGCDDCQLVCPFNYDAPLTSIDDFHPRKQLCSQTLQQIFAWSEEDFLKHTEGSAIRRIGYIQWLRNIAIGLGNAPASHEIMQLLTIKKTQHPTETILLEHIDWALQQQYHKTQSDLD